MVLSEMLSDKILYLVILILLLFLVNIFQSFKTSKLQGELSGTKKAFDELFGEYEKELKKSKVTYTPADPC